MQGVAEVATQAAPGETPLLTSVYFHVANSTSLGEVVRVVGNHPSIGAWDPAKGLTLSTTEEVFPIWTTAEPIGVELHYTLEYKYVVAKPGEGDGLETYTWEERENRLVTVSGAEMIVEDDDGLYRQHCSGLGKDEEDDEDDEYQPLQVRSPSVRRLDKDEKMTFVHDLEGSVKITNHDTVFMVSFQLPVNVCKNAEGKWIIEEKAPNDGRNFAFLPLVEELRVKKNMRVMCVGWIGQHIENSRDRREIQELLEKKNYIPVWPGKQEFEEYQSFCVTFLWPVFHDVMLFFQTANPRPFNEQGWAAYQHMNNVYASAVVPHTHENDLIWVHDYHLMMVPTFISRKLIKANIGFYLHTPFPSSDSFKSLPVREELLAGMLCADQVGFQFFAYARNFLVSVKRIYGLDPTFRAGGFMGVDYNGRLVMIKVSHFVYPYEDTVRLVDSDEVAQKATEVRSLFQGKTIFASMDRCDNLSGLVPKFRAFKRFLKDYPMYRGKAVLVQYCFETMGGVVKECGPSLVESLREMADAFLQPDSTGKLRVVAKTGRAVDQDCDIYLLIGQVTREDRLGLFRSADVLLDTSVKAGLNLMPLEFITAHYDDEKRGARHGLSMISEFTGCSRVLLGSLRVNPWNTAELVNCCQKAITMGPEERLERWKSNSIYVADSSPMDWFEDFLTDLRRARKKEGIRIESIGFGAKIRHVCVNHDFAKLAIEEVCASYRAAKNRIFFLDNEGTLAADKRHLYREYGAPKGDVDDLKAHGTAPDETVLQCLRVLCSDSRNTVVILSGRDRKMLEEWFKGVPRICLAAERGFYYKLPTLTSDQWHCMKSNPDYTWKSYAFEIMRQFVKRTQGSFIENKGSALVWQYRNSDQHFGSWQAKELSSHLKELLFGFEVDVIEGKGYVEVKLRGINKGTSVTRLWSKVVAAYGEVDFILCIGDDRSDEDMFEAVNDLVDPSQVAEANPDGTTTPSTRDADSDEQVPLGRTNSMERQRLDSADAAVGGGLSMSLGRSSGGLGGLRSKSSFGGLGGFGMGTSSGDLSAMGGGFGEGAADGRPRRRFFTCTVGRKPSAARFYVDDTDEVSELLTSLRTSGRKSTKDSCMPSFHTWSGGDTSGRRSSTGSMPSLSSVSFPERVKK